jgi:hypothetical protein
VTATDDELGLADADWEGDVPPRWHARLKPAPDNEQVSTRVTGEAAEALRAIARQEGITVSALIRRWIMAELTWRWDSSKTGREQRVQPRPSTGASPKDPMRPQCRAVGCDEHWNAQRAGVVDAIAPTRCKGSGPVYRQSTPGPPA